MGSAEWNLLTDEVSWSPELYGIFGRTGRDGPLSLDELPSWVDPEDQPALATAFTDCLVDGKAIDQEFRLVRPDGSVGTVHMVGEPVLDGDGSTASMWAVVRDVSALRRSEHTVRQTRDSVQHQRGTSPGPSTGWPSNSRRPCCRPGAARCGSRRATTGPARSIWQRTTCPPRPAR